MRFRDVSAENVTPSPQTNAAEAKTALQPLETATDQVLSFRFDCANKYLEIIKSLKLSIATQ